MDSVWFIISICVLSIIFGALGMLFYLTVIKNYPIEFKKSKNNLKKDKFDPTDPRNIAKYENEDTKSYNFHNTLAKTGNFKSIKTKVVMISLFILCAIVGGYVGYTMMKGVDSIIKEKHHQYKTITMVFTVPEPIKF